MIGRLLPGVGVVLFAAWLGIAACAAWLGIAVCTAAPARQTAREQVGKPVQAAEQLAAEKKLPEALARLSDADAVPGKSPYETYIIEATRAAVYLDGGQYADAITALEAALATNVLPPAEALQRVATITGLAWQLRNYPAVVSYAERYYKSGGADAQPRLLMAQAYYARADFADAAEVCRVLLRDAVA